jgi:hypothetical protein
MPDSIALREVRLSRLDPDRMTAAMRRSGVAWHELTVRVHNPSAATTVHVISDVRRIHLDATRRALVVHFGEQGVTAGIRSRERPAPLRTIAVEPGEEATLRYRLSSPMTFLIQSNDGEQRSHTVRLEDDVDIVECFVAYGVQPPRPIDLTSHEARRPAREWGSTVHASCRPRSGRQSE